MPCPAVSLFRLVIRSFAAYAVCERADCQKVLCFELFVLLSCLLPFWLLADTPLSRSLTHKWALPVWHSRLLVYLHLGFWRTCAHFTLFCHPLLPSSTAQRYGQGWGSGREERGRQHQPGWSHNQLLVPHCWKCQCGRTHPTYCLHTQQHGLHRLTTGSHPSTPVLRPCMLLAFDMSGCGLYQNTPCWLGADVARCARSRCVLQTHTAARAAHATARAKPSDLAVTAWERAASEALRVRCDREYAWAVRAHQTHTLLQIQGAGRSCRLLLPMHLLPGGPPHVFWVSVGTPRFRSESELVLDLGRFLLPATRDYNITHHQSNVAAHMRWRRARKYPTTPCTIWSDLWQSRVFPLVCVFSYLQTLAFGASGFPVLVCQLCVCARARIVCASDTIRKRRDYFDYVPTVTENRQPCLTDDSLPCRCFCLSDGRYLRARAKSAPEHQSFERKLTVKPRGEGAGNPGAAVRLLAASQHWPPTTCAHAHTHTPHRHRHTSDSHVASCLLHAVWLVVADPAVCLLAVCFKAYLARSSRFCVHALHRFVVLAAADTSFLLLCCLLPFSFTAESNPPPACGPFNSHWGER